MLLKINSLISKNKNILNLYIYKGFYQIIYLIFNFYILKQLNVKEFGNYSYVLATIVYLNSFIALGFPIYLQNKFSTEEPLDISYIYVVLINIVISVFIVFVGIDMPWLIKLMILLILVANFLSTIISTLYNALADYSQQYKILLVGSLWYVVLLNISFFLKKEINLEIILTYWSISAIFLSLWLVWQLFKFKKDFKLEQGKFHIKHAALAMFTIYAVGFPYEFSRFYDKWLIKETLDEVFLGIYSFNLFVILTIYSFFIRPLGSILVTNFSKAKKNMKLKLKAIKGYYAIILIVFLLLAVGYLILNDWLLSFIGLNQYKNSSYIFIYLLISTFLYALSVPFIISLNLGTKNSTRGLFVIISIIIFGLLYGINQYYQTNEIFLLSFTIYNAFSFFVVAILEKTLLNEILNCLKLKKIK